MSDDTSPSFFGRLRRTLIGKPIPKSQAHHERLSPAIGLPVFASDALSSVAYATEAIVGVLILKSLGFLEHQFAISLAIVVLIIIVSLSYSQTINAYPKGGGSYIVATENLGQKSGLLAGGMLLLDYILTVSVSIAAGVVAIVSAFPVLHPYLVQIALLFIAFVAWLNLRGVKESGTLFAIPTYGFVISMVVLIGTGIYRSVMQGPVNQVIQPDPLIGSEVHFATSFILLRAFAAGCTALTGIEAVSDGVPAFKAPESKNANKTLRWMAIILSTLFLGMGYLAQHVPELALHKTSNPEYKTLSYQIAVFAFGGPGSPLVYVLQFFTAAILILAANTAFADFPRLASFLSRDGYLPRYLARQGDRLVFHNGIILLAISAGILIWQFDGELDQLLPLYAVGVFTAFTVSQCGMVAYWLKNKLGNWKVGLAINGLGAFCCFIVLNVILVTKFKEGAWLILILIVPLIAMFLWVKRRYAAMASQLQFQEVPAAGEPIHYSVLLVPRVHRGVLSALQYGRTLKGELRAVHIIIDEKGLPELQRNWKQVAGDVELVVLPSPFRSLIEPMLDYVDKLRNEQPNTFVTVIVPEAVSKQWIHRFLHDNLALQLKRSLAGRSNVVVANVRYFLD